MRLHHLAPAVSAAVIAALLAVPAQAAPAESDPVTPSATVAQQALADAQALFAPAAPSEARRTESGPDSRDATLVLRDLNLHKDQLNSADRATADRLLARPARGTFRDFPSVRVHWSSSDRAVTDAYVNEVGRTARHVLATYAAAGYRAPERDGSRGGNNKLDIYLQDLGSQGLYGYCDTDSPPPSGGPYDTPAYCAFDDDYAEFPRTPLQNLRVTAAHELFHAVQFAYDYTEDAWFMEATAVWAEDEVYDGVNDNLQYLRQSPLTQPDASMDHFTGLRQYGDWIFYRYLTERFPAAQGGLPTLIRQIWRRADGSAGAADDYSIRATARELVSRGTSLRSAFARFADANRRPGRSYDEGAANHYPAAPLAGSVKLSGGHRASAWKSRRVDHLASATFRFQRVSGLAARKLAVRVDLPPTARGSAAVLTIYRTSARPQTKAVRLSSRGNAIKRVGFGRAVKKVEVSLVNASTRYRCGAAPSAGFSCSGRALDDDLRMRVSARAVR
jgi:hypothetical protein